MRATVAAVAAVTAGTSFALVRWQQRLRDSGVICSLW